MCASIIVIFSLSTCTNNILKRKKMIHKEFRVICLCMKYFISIKVHYILHAKKEINDDDYCYQVV